jgi:hypothetical protein
MVKRVCNCSCHTRVTVHPTTCGCDKAAPPPPCCHDPAPKPCCPPLKNPDQPGTVEVPQPTAPPGFTTGTSTVGSSTKPPPGSAAEGPWFTNTINNTVRNGPIFGPRKDEFLPYLLVRSSAGDRGSRPLSGVFWESPDIFVVPNQDADTAPPTPATFGGIAQANAPNTLYAHIWNLGRAPAYRVRVEFYWFNPSLGINRGDANLIGATYIDLADRFSITPGWQQVTTAYGQWMSAGNHAVVRCPVTWIPTFQNNGHECLVVRAFEPMLDAADPDQFAAVNDRHVGQRNIAVVQAASPASIDLALNLGYPESPANAEVTVAIDPPTTMDWLQLFAGSRAPGYTSAGGGVFGFLPPTVAASRVPPLGQLAPDERPKLLRPRESFLRGCCPMQIVFHASADNLASKQVQVLRIRQRLGTEIVGGYSVVLLKR